MKNKSSTKKSLLFSVLSLFLSLVLLAGTTFAWFTDTASTSVNTIHSGTLDITLEDSEGNSLEGQSLSFLRTAADGIIHPAGDILWEPGATFETDSFHVVNQGNLAVKYKILLNPPEGSSKLAEVIDWSIQIGDVKHNTIPGSSLSIDASEFIGHLAPEEISEEIMIIAHMQEDAGNDYQNLALSGISFQVFATQDTVEYDSFTHTYDAQAQFDTNTEPVVNPDPAIDPDPSLTDPKDPTYSDNPQYAWDPINHRYVLIDSIPDDRLVYEIVYIPTASENSTGENESGGRGEDDQSGTELQNSGDQGQSDLLNLNKQVVEDTVQFQLKHSLKRIRLVLPAGFTIGANNEIIGINGKYYKLELNTTTGAWGLVETSEPWPANVQQSGVLNIRTGKWIIL